MAVRQNVVRRRIEVTSGVDNTTVVGSPRLQGTMSQALNADIINDSIIVKRRGYQKVNSAGQWSSKRIRKLFQYFNGDVNEVLAYSEDQSASNTSGELAKLDGTSTPVSITSGLNDGVIPSIVQFQDRAFVFTEGENLQYDGTDTRGIGITAPTVAPTQTGSIPGDLVPTSPYVFAYTYYNSDTGAESSPSLGSPVITTGSAPNTGVRLNVVAGSPATADKIRVWRTVAGGEIFFLDGDTDISSVLYDSTIGDLELGQQLELDNTPLQEPGKYAVENENRIFVAVGDNTVRYSKIGQNGPMPESFQVLDFVDCNPNNGDKIKGLGVVNNTVIVVKERSFGRLTRVSLNEATFEEQGSTKYIYEEISRENTATNHHCILTIDNLLVWLGQDDIYATDGVRVIRIGSRILNTVRGKINFNQQHKFHAIVKKDTQQIIFNVCRIAENEPDFQIVGSYQKQAKFAWTFYSPGEDKTTHPGLRAGSMAEVVDGGVRKYLFGSSDSVGYVYRFDYGTSDDSNGIYFDVRMTWEHYDNAARKKLYHSYFFNVLGDGNVYSLTMSFELDNQESIVYTEIKPLHDGTNEVWDVPNWDEFNWAGTKYERLTFHPHKRAYFGRVGFQNINADQPVAIKGITSQAIIDPLH